MRGEGRGAASRRGGRRAAPPRPQVRRVALLRLSFFGFLSRRGRGAAAGGRGRGTALGRLGVLDHGDLGVLELYAGLALEHRAALGERGRLVGLLGQLALGVGLGVRSAVLDQLQQSVGAFALHAGGTAAERRQFPRVSRLHGGAFGRREAQSREVCGQERDRR